MAGTGECGMVGCGNSSSYAAVRCLGCLWGAVCPLLPHLDHTMGLGLPLCPYIKPFPGSGCPRSSVKLWHGVSGARALIWLGFGGTVKQQLLGKTSFHLSGGKQHLGTPHECSLGFSSPYVCPRASPNSQGGLSLPRRSPGLGRPGCGSTLSHPRVSVHP